MHLNQAVTKDGEDTKENKYFGLELSELDTKNKREESKKQNSSKHKNRHFNPFSSSVYVTYVIVMVNQ